LDKLPKRHEIPNAYTWDLEAVYKTDEDWEAEFRAIRDGLPELASFQGRLAESPDLLLDFLRKRDQVSIKLEQVMVYAHLKRDQDTAVALYQGMNDRSNALASQFAAAVAFARPEILSIPADTLRSWKDGNLGLAEYGHYLEDLLREKEHVRSAEVEALLAEFSEVAGGPYQIYSLLTNADLTFPPVRDETGIELELTQERWGRFRESRDRRVRKDAYEALYSSYRAHRNSIAVTLSTAVKKNVLYARARRFATALEAALHAYNIPVEVYHNLVKAVNENLHLLHRYAALRKRLLGVEQLHHYDLYVPLVPTSNREFPWKESQQTVLDACAPLGDSYVEAARTGFRQRWADVYENVNKRSGAYSGGSYTTHPYMLLNHQDDIQSLYTLAHELGHSMHSYFARQSQPYIYGDYSIFVAEVASTVNEALLTDHLVRSTEDEAFKLYLVNRHLEAIRTTLYRQTMFAEFELEVHGRVENGEALTAEGMSEFYAGLNRKYYGAEVVEDENIAHEWARIPHFFYNFYVYQYATGISAAEALSLRILQGEDGVVDRYLQFLRRGSSEYPIDQLRTAGVDMTSPEPVRAALQVFGKLIDQMEKLTGALR
jgi:oligoendopeptidase F